MVTRLLILLGLAASAQAVTARVTITDQTGVGHTRPVMLARWFREGDITQYAKPSIVGVGVPAIWQNDVKNRWQNHQDTVSVVGATNTQPIRITTASPHGFKEGAVVTTFGIGGNAGANGVHTIRNVTPLSYDLMNAVPTGAYTSGGAATGPTGGGLKFAVITFSATFTANGSIQVDFVDSADQCSSGDAAACSAAGLDKAGMLAFAGGTWNATTTVTQASTPYSATARDMLIADKYTYWLRGPAVTMIVLEDASFARSYDFGYGCQSGCTSPYSSAAWVADATYRSIHPIFGVTFHYGWAGVKEEFVLENEWTTALQDQKYDLTFSTSEATVLSTTNYLHFARTRFRKTYWDGDEPGGDGKEYLGLKIDYNLSYLKAAKMVLPYDQTLADPTPSVAGMVAGFDANQTSGLEGMVCPGTTLCGNVTFSMPDTGDRADLGVLSGWEVKGIYTWDPDMMRVVRGNSDVMGLVPVHFRESSSSFPTYDLAGQVPSMGMTMSMDSRTTLALDSYPTQLGTVAGDKINAVGSISGTSVHKWTPQYHHWPSSVYIAYATTGEWWYWTQLRDITANAMGWASAQTLYNPAPVGKQFALPYIETTRGWAWNLRDYIYGAKLAPDGTPEQNYFQQKLNNFWAYNDGAANYTGSKFYEPGTSSPYNYATETKPWALGRGWLRAIQGMGGWPNPLGISPSLGECGSGSNPPTNGIVDLTVIPTSQYCGKWFMWAYMFQVLHVADVLGEPVANVRAAIKPFVVEQVQATEGSIYNTDSYESPARPADVNDVTLLSSIGATQSSTTPIAVNAIPDYWVTEIASGPVVVKIDNEWVKVCSVDVGASTFTPCAGSCKGRAFWGCGNASHTSGTVVRAWRNFQTWEDRLRGYLTPVATSWNWTFGTGSFGNWLLSAVAGFADTTSRGYSGLAAYSAVHDAWLVNASYGATILDPRNLLEPEEAPATTSISTAIRGRVGLR